MLAALPRCQAIVRSCAVLAVLLSGGMLGQRATAADTQAVVPAIIGEVADVAKRKIEAAGLVPKFHVGKPAASEDLKWRVYASSPETGRPLAPGSTVDVTLYDQPLAGQRAAGGAGPSGAVPDVVGLTAPQAKHVLEQAGLEAQFQLGRPAPAAAEAHTVYRQTPGPEDATAESEAVSLLVYDAPSAAAVASGAPQQHLVAVATSEIPDRSEGRIDPISGALRLEVTDLSVPAGPTELAVRRTYRGPRGLPGMLGASWRLNWEKQVLDAGGVPALAEADRLIVFRFDPADKRFRSPAGDELSFHGDGLTRICSDGGQETYGPSGQVVEMLTPSGASIHLDYSENGRLRGVSGPFGAALEFFYDGRQRLVEVRSSAGTSVRYAYGEAREADAPLGLTVQYAYDQAGRLTSIAHPQTGTTLLGYDTAGRVVSRRWPDGAEERYRYEPDLQTTWQTDPLGRVTVTRWTADGTVLGVLDPLGRKTLFRYDEGRLVWAQGPTGQSVRFAYDALGRLQHVANPASGECRFEYAGDSRRPSAIVTGSGLRADFQRQGGRHARTRIGDSSSPGKVQIEYDGNGLLVRAVHGDRAVRLAYDDHGFVQSTTDAAGNVTRLECDRRGNVVRVVDPLGSTVARTYDDRGLLRSVTDATGAETRFEYSPAGSLKSVIGPLGGIASYQYDSRGRVVAQSDPVGRVTRYEYALNGKLVSITTPGGHTTALEWDAGDNLIGATNPLGGVTTGRYDALGRLIHQTDPAGSVTRWTYDTAGRLAERVDAAGAVSRFEYDDRGQVTAVTDAAGGTWHYEYGDDGKLVRLVPPRGPATQFEYDAAGNLAAVLEGQLRWTEYDSDALGRPVRERLATGLETTYQYDAAGRLVAWNDSTGGGGKVQRDPLGRPVEIEDAVGAVTKLQYDAAGRLVAMAKTGGGLQRRAYNAAGELVAVVAPTGDQAAYGYDADGNLVEMRHPGGGRTVYARDAMGNVLRIDDPADGKTVFEYDKAGRPVRKTDGKGQTTTFTYDQAGRLTERHLPGGKVVHYSYDQRGNLLEADDGQFPVRYEYDARDNVTQIDYPALKRSLRYRYDDYGRLAEFTDSEGHTTLYKYDAMHRLQAVAIDDGAAVTFAYDAKDQPVSVTYPNGVRGQWQYDVAGRVTALAYTGADGQTLAGWSYEYDADGNCVRTQSTDQGTTQYRYDLAGQLLEESTDGGRRVQYSYRPGGNRAKRVIGDQSVEYRYDQADRLLQAGDEKFQYDANGNLVQRHGPQGITKYAYDAEDRLIQVDLPDGTSVRYGYGPTGERIWRRVGEDATWFVTDGTNLLAELDKDLDVRRAYVHAIGVDRPLMMIRDGERYCYHVDRLGSVRCLTDATGSPIARYQFDGFGQGSIPTDGPGNPFGFTAREQDPRTALYYFRARWYDPSIGRFLSRDPAPPRLEDVASLNPYVYVANCPLTFTDPFGAEPNDPRPPIRINLLPDRSYDPRPLPPGLDRNTTLYHYTSPDTKDAVVYGSRRMDWGPSGETLHVTTYPPGQGPPGGIGTPRDSRASIGVRAGDLADAGHVIEPNTNRNYEQGRNYLIVRQPGQGQIRFPNTVRGGGGYGRPPASRRNRRGSAIMPNVPRIIAEPTARAGRAGGPAALGLLGLNVAADAIEGRSPGEIAVRTGRGVVEGTVKGSILVGLGALGGAGAGALIGGPPGAYAGAELGAGFTSGVLLGQSAIDTGQRLGNALGEWAGPETSTGAPPPGDQPPPYLPPDGPTDPSGSQGRTPTTAATPELTPNVDPGGPPPPGPLPVVPPVSPGAAGMPPGDGPYLPPLFSQPPHRRTGGPIDTLPEGDTGRAPTGGVEPPEPPSDPPIVPVVPPKEPPEGTGESSAEDEGQQQDSDEPSHGQDPIERIVEQTINQLIEPDPQEAAQPSHDPDTGNGGAGDVPASWREGEDDDSRSTDQGSLGDYRQRARELSGGADGQPSSGYRSAARGIDQQLTAQEIARQRAIQAEIARRRAIQAEIARQQQAARYRAWIQSIQRQYHNWSNQQHHH